MTKMVSLRVIVPADDEAPIADVQKRLREHLEGFGTESPLTGIRDGEPARAACALAGGRRAARLGRARPLPCCPPRPQAARDARPGLIASVSHESALESCASSRPARRLSRRRKPKPAGKGRSTGYSMSAGTRSSTWLIEAGKVLQGHDCFPVLFVCYFFIHRMLRQIPTELRPGLPDMARALSRLAEDAAAFVEDEEQE